MTELAPKREALVKVWEFLNPRDQSFADSLIKFFDRNKSWSEKQLYWVDTLIQRGKDAEPKPEQGRLPLDHSTPTTTFHGAAKSVQNLPRPEAVENLIRISQLFEKAREQGLKYPKIRLEAEDGIKVVLRYSSSLPNQPPFVNVTDQLPYGAGRQFFGKITSEGVFVRTWRATPAILKLLNELAKDPVGLAKLYGLKTSTCCFCSRPLETSESVTVGYGPICAEKFGLPWGQKVETTYTCLTMENNSVNAEPHTSGQ